MTNIGTHPMPVQKRAVAHASTPSRRERDETYRGVIVVLSDRYRVIIDEKGDQFILQKHYVENLHGGVWRSISYVVSRDKLIELSASLGLLSEPSKRAVLEALPSTAREYALKQVRP
jgi:hypothetical protein